MPKLGVRCSALFAPEVESQAPAYDFFAGTFFPCFRAFDNPMAIACFRLVTFFPLRPLFSFPFFISFISVSTFLPAEGEYFRDDDFLEDDFFAGFLLDEDLCDLAFEDDCFLAAFFVAIPTS